MYKRDSQLIPLECIDHHWWKLDLLPVTIPIIKGINYHKDVEFFFSSFLHGNKEARIRMLNKLWEISNLISSFLTDPVKKLLAQGRGKQKHDKLMHRNPYAFELVASRVDNSSPSMKSVLVSRKNDRRKIPRDGHPMEGICLSSFRVTNSVLH